ncbi:ABC-transporter [Theobroma cacao]|nr:ABC-transporter [Theobroma cacao]WRX22121.1 ABC-transporter [Theobroma cacao]
MDGTENARASRSKSSHNNLSSSIRSSLSRTTRRMDDVFAGASRLSGSSTRVAEEEEALRRAAIEKLPTYDRLGTSIINSFVESNDHLGQEQGNHHEFAPREVDVRKLEMDDRQKFINALFIVVEEDNEKFLKRFRNRVDKAGTQLPTVEVRLEHLNIEADTYRGSRALPTLPNEAAELALGVATAIEGAESSLATDYIFKVLGLDICKDTVVGNEMNGGVSGGQKKRVTTGEMIVGPTKTLLMDEISTGLDSSTTYQIVKCLQQIAHLTDATIFMSLLQPAPETFDLFDDVVLISRSKKICS